MKINFFNSIKVNFKCSKQKKDPCNPNPCQNGGQCQTNGNNFHCICPPQYSGSQCSNNLMPTAPPSNLINFIYN